MATLETSPEANCDRRTDGQTDRQADKATYRGSSYRSAQKSDDPPYEYHDCIESLEML